MLWNVHPRAQQWGLASKSKGRTQPNAGRAADCLQRPLRSRFRQQLTPSVRRQRRGGKNYKKTSQAKV